MLINKNELNLIKNLGKKQQRNADRMFVAEGSRSVLDLLLTKPNDAVLIAATSEWIMGQAAKLKLFSKIIREISSSQLSAVSSLKTTSEVIAVFRYPEFSGTFQFNGRMAIYLDGISDPGNLGTIIRNADWFGIPEILLSPGSVDPFNTKTIQASMSSIGRVKISFIRPSAIREYSLVSQLIGASMEGVSMYDPIDQEHFILCLGNESHGLSEELRALCDVLVSIPSASLGSESLNVAVASGVLMSHFMVR